MIGSLRGRLLARLATGELLVEVCGVGYRVRATESAVRRLAPVNSEVFLHVHHVVRADDEMLYGFAAADERDTFEVLLGAHRVGPALALAILDVHNPDALRRAVSSDDVDALCMVPGVGPKTAIRLLVELRSKLKLEDAEAPPGEPTAGTAPDDSLRADVRDALATLGYGASEIRLVMDELPGEGDFETLVRSALRLVTRRGRSGRQR